MTPWLASFVRRWHCDPDLCHTVDPISGHSARMGILALHLWPDCSRELLVACLTHDLGESATGDVPFSLKDAAPDIDEMLSLEECTALMDMGMMFAPINPTDARRLKFLDRLDAYLWAKHHAPHIMDRDGWPEALAWLQRTADELQAEVAL